MIKELVKSFAEKNKTIKNIYYQASVIKSTIFSVIPDKEYLKYRYKKVFGKELCLDNPQTFNEKLQWLKLYNRKPEYTVMVDKHLVKKYVADIIGEEYIIPTFAVWNTPEEVDIDSLPEKFVIKCNHNSGVGMLICKDKSKVDKKSLIRELHKGLRNNYYLGGREWPYKDVKRLIFAERYLENPLGGALYDYKVLCFDGEPKLIELHKGRFSPGYTEDFYDTKWNKTNIQKVGDPISEKTEPKPEKLEEMLDLSRKLAKGIPHVRVDWYLVAGKLYFGEITFFDDSGFTPFINPEDDKMQGDWITLPSKCVD